MVSEIIWYHLFWQQFLLKIWLKFYKSAPDKSLVSFKQLIISYGHCSLEFLSLKFEHIDDKRNETREVESLRSKLSEFVFDELWVGQLGFEISQAICINFN